MATRKHQTKVKQFVHNQCAECNAEAVSTLVVPLKGKKKMMWCCSNGHQNNHRRYTVSEKKN